MMLVQGTERSPTKYKQRERTVRMVRGTVREEGASQILQDLLGYDEDFEFFPKTIGMPLMNFKQRSEIIRMCDRKRLTEDQQEHLIP